MLSKTLLVCILRQNNGTDIFYDLEVNAQVKGIE